MIYDKAIIDIETCCEMVNAYLMADRDERKAALSDIALKSEHKSIILIESETGIPKAGIDKSNSEHITAEDIAILMNTSGLSNIRVNDVYLPDAKILFLLADSTQYPSWLQEAHIH